MKAVRNAAWILLLAWVPVPASAQEGLNGSARAVQRALAERDWGGVREWLRPDGVLLHLHDETHSGLAPGQALAALRDFFDAHEAGGMRSGRVAATEGDPGRGFAEMEWDTVVLGTSEAVRYRLFTSLVWDEGRWWIDELRVLPRAGRGRV